MRKAREKVVIGSAEFSSRTALERHARSVVEKYASGELMSDEDRDFMLNLIQARHKKPETKILQGLEDQIVGVKVRHGDGLPHYGTAVTNRNHCFVAYADGGEIDFSWKRCCTGDFSHDDDVNRAMRRAVAPQVHDYKILRFGPHRGGSVTCDATGVAVAWNECQIDHYPLTFVAVRDRFLAAEQTTIAAIQVKPDGRGGCVMADDGLLLRWQLFHQAEATLRLVSTEENRRSWRTEGATRV